MPIYTYECKKCQKIIEVSQRMIEAPFRVHSEADSGSKCNGEVRRLLHAPALQFKGTGFYETDYKRKGKEAPDKTSSDGTKQMKATVTKKGEKADD